ncbi:AIG2-like protein [Pochonia chlamydosporia 170]|uniref:AIG2-like protein n=1 Tax=Pochonia chlamydosporia 170 TaxID=1380566 RepID=A0A179FKX9_METCM|nr:AIG2-like protein [Pochonia chlamydosporia 170]OAQ65870.2 AIG2-like protein [Pochonia chlamydosporia 170]
MSTEPKPLFVYGTLCAKQLLAWALTGEQSNAADIEFMIRPARVFGSARYGVYGCDYPAVVPHNSSDVNGYLITFQNNSQRRKLDDFEGEAYKAVATKAHILDNNDQPCGEEVDADIYIWNGADESLTGEPWDLQYFIDERLEDWLDLFEGMELTGGDHVDRISFRNLTVGISPLTYAYVRKFLSPAQIVNSRLINSVMVGVPGRTTACSTCRQRKKKCDRQQPECSRCIKAGLTCGGYGKPGLIWLSATANTNKGNSNGESSSQSQPWAVRYMRPEYTKMLIRTAREQQHLGMFWTSFLPRGREFSLKASKVSTGGWTRALDKLYDAEAALRKASLALSVSLLGERTKDTATRVSGLLLYDQAVRETSNALQSAKRAKTDGVLAAVRLMALHEAMFSPLENRQVKGWRRHNDGQLALFLLRGPSAFISQPSHQLFVDGRLNIIIAAITRRTKSPLSAKEWQTVPWEIHEKCVKDRLLDIMNEIPWILEQQDNLQNLPPSHQKDKVPGILHQCKRQAMALEKWRRHDETDAVLSMFDLQDEDEPLPSPKDEVELAGLHLTGLYWIAGLLLYSTLWTVSDVVNGVQRDEVNQKSKVYERATRAYAKRMAYSVHLFFEESSSEFEKSTGLYPLIMASQLYRRVKPVPEEQGAREAIRRLVDEVLPA